MDNRKLCLPTTGIWNCKTIVSDNAESFYLNLFHLLKCLLAYNRSELSATSNVTQREICSYGTNFIWRWSPGHHCTSFPSTLFFSCLTTLLVLFCKGLFIDVRPFGTLRTKESSQSINTAQLSLQEPCVRSRTNFWAGSWSDIHREENITLWPK